MPARFTDKVAVVTGGAGGIGREHSLLFAKEGARVVVNDVGTGDVGDNQHSDASRVVKEIEEAGGTAVVSTASAATFEGAKSIVEQAIDTFGRVDILINNASSWRVDDVWRFTEEDWDFVLNVNMKGYLAMIKYAAPHFAKQRSGVIVNTSSGSGFGHPSMVAYSTAKEGVIGLTRTTAMELGRFGVRCNAIRPQADSYQARKTFPEKSKRWDGLLPILRGTGPMVFDPELRANWKVSAVVAWLCSDAAKNVNGRTFRISGDVVALYSEPVVERSLYKEGGFTLDDLDSVGGQLVSDLTNSFTLDGHPEWQVFDE